MKYFFFLKKINFLIIKINLKNTINKNSIIFFFLIYILILNLFGLLPFYLPYRSQFFISLNLSFFSYFIIIYFKIIKNIRKFLLFNIEKNNIFNIIIKCIEIIIQIITLSMRLRINITTSHLIFSIYSNNIIFIFFYIFYEIFVCFIQRFVFFLLTNLYYS